MYHEKFSQHITGFHRISLSIVNFDTNNYYKYTRLLPDNESKTRNLLV